MPPRKSTSSVTPADAEDAMPTQTTDQQLKAQADGGSNVEDYLLPRAVTQRLAKSVLPPNTTIQKDALLAIQKAATVFVSYLSSHANEATLKRTLAPSDVLSALSAIEFDSFKPRLERELDAHTEALAGKKRATKEKKAAVAANATVTGADAAKGVKGGVQAGDKDEDETTARVAKRVKRGSDAEGVAQTAIATTNNAAVAAAEDETEEEPEVDEDETEEAEDEEGEEDDDEEEDDEHEAANDDNDRVEDLEATGGRRHQPEDDDDSDDYDDDGPGAQLRENMALNYLLPSR